ncbi:MAG: hypothetical protein B7Y02_18820 [Rhodobacterales bacterium 17-64-5]|nr:MAG: hypothetical protein B7Y02_18820 [Rhodobacterales bacterium 17-64-5]
MLYAAALRPTLAALDSVPGVFMTSEAGFKFIAASLPAQFPRHLARQERLLLGQDGSLNQPFLWGRNAYTVDSQALSVLFRAGSGT